MAARPRPGIQRGSSVATSTKTIVLVTGGNAGIGYEIVKSLASLRSDYQILLGCRDISKGEVAASSMGAPSNVNPIQLDIADDSSVENAAKAIEQHFGRLDILINNAGTAGADLHREGNKPTSRELWSHVLNTNVVGTGVLTDRLIPLLEQSKAPRIIFISSDVGSIGKALKTSQVLPQEFVPYSSSKSAVNMMVVHYSILYPHIKVNACCPGLRGTAIHKETNQEGDMNPELGAVEAVRLATTTDGATATFTNSEGTIPW